MSNGIQNKLICGDNLETLKEIPNESIDLIYIDPPFFTHRQYEVIWGDEAEIRSFKDRWEGGIEHYISWLTPRVKAMYEVLKPTGTFYIHCDHHADAHIRIMLDDIFGQVNFRNEIIWCYTGPSRNVRDFPDKHDVIFRYAKSDKFIFNPIRIAYSESFLKRREYIEGSGGIFKGKFERKKEEIEQFKKGKLIEDWWDDIPSGGQISRNELMGYPTQKPEALLERIITASSNKGYIVLDAFCGCGTAMAVAHRLQRKWIGIDISPTAIKIIERRLKKSSALRDRDYIVIGEPTTIKALKKLEPFEFQNWVINEMQAKHMRTKTGDKGLDGYIDEDLYHKAAGIQVKQSEDIGRNVVDNFKAALERGKYKKGYIVAFSFGKGASEEVARLKNAGDMDIELVTVERLLSKKAGS